MPIDATTQAGTVPVPPSFDDVEDERLHRKQRLAEAAGTPIRIDDEQAALTATQVGGHYVGWLSFQPLYERIVREQPDLFD